MTVNKHLEGVQSEPAPERREVKLLNEQANESATAMTVREHLVAQAAGWGNGYAELQWLGNGQLHAIHSLQSSRMKVFLVRDATGSARIQYLYTNDWGHRVEIPRDSIIHVTGPTDNGLVGFSISKYANESIGSGLAQQDYAASFFGNGSVPGGVLEHPSALSADAQNRLRANWEAIHRSSSNAFRIGILEEGMKYSPVTVSPKDAELIATRRYTIEEVARWFRMPLAKIQHHLNAKGWSTTEMEGQHYLIDTLLPWLVRIEQEITRKLFPADDYFVKHNTNALLRADAKSRSEFYAKMQMIGAYNINEIRAFEDLNNIGQEGDKRFISNNLMPLDRALDPKRKFPDPSTTPNNRGREKEEREDEDDEARHPLVDGDEISVMSKHIRPYIAKAAHRIIDKECKAMNKVIKRYSESVGAQKNSPPKIGSTAPTPEATLQKEARKFFDTQCKELLKAVDPGCTGPSLMQLQSLCRALTEEGFDTYTSGAQEEITERQEQIADRWVTQLVITLESVARYDNAA
jgi:HK97 family phage portal protein